MASAGGVTICAANVTSLNTQLDEVLQLPGHIMGLTEVRLTKSSQMEIQRQLEEVKWSVVWGKPQAEWKSQWGAKAGGVGIVSRPGVPLQEVKPVSQTQRELWESGRCVHAATAMGNGSVALHVFCVYGFSGAAGNNERMALNEQLLSKVFAAAAELGNVPVVVVGDLNVPPDASLVISSALMTGRWVDAACAVAVATGTTPDATCYVRDTSEGTRIDAVLCNSVAGSALLDFGVVVGSGLPVHLPVACSLEYGTFSQLAPSVCKPRAMPLAWRDPEPEAEQWQADRCVAEVWRNHSEDWQVALVGANVEKLWRIWSAAAEKYLYNRATSAGQELPSKLYSGRGAVKIRKVHRSASSSQPAEGADSSRIKQLQKFARQVEQLVRDMTYQPAHWGHHQTRLEEKVARKAIYLMPAWQRVEGAALSIGSLQQLGGMVREAIQRSHEEARQGRLSAWKQWLDQAWGEKRIDVYKWCKGVAEERTSLVQRPDGTLTANVDEIDDLLSEAWLPIFRMYADKPPPDWNTFAERFGSFTPRGPVMDEAALDAQALRKTLSKMKSTGSCGMDGWRISEIKALPDFFLHRLAEFLNIVEVEGVWPDALSQGAVSLISKGEGADPLKLRPISVMPVVYRLWAATRVKGVLRWQETWLAEELHGFRPAHGAEDVWWVLAVKLEQALLSGQELSGMSLDYSKCFDRVPIEIVLEVAERCGMDAGIMRAMRAMYKQLRRRFVLNGAVGKPFQSTNGILQGCPLSIVFLNLLVHTWATAVKEEAPEADPSGYADDTGAVVESAADLQPVANTTDEFAKLTGQKLNVEKSKCWSTASEGESALGELQLDGGHFAVVKSLRCLGAHLRATKGGKNTTLEDRIVHAVQVARRIAWIGLPFRVKAELTSSLVVQASLYGVQVGGLTAKLLNQLQSACMKAVWGMSRKLRAKELVMTLLLPGHRVDPKQAAAYQCLKMLRAMVSKHPEMEQVLRNVWQICEENAGRRAYGPVGLVFEVVDMLGWTWPTFLQFHRPGRAPLPLTGNSDGWWLHEVRDALRCAMWKAVAVRRQDCAGLEASQGVDRIATLKYSGKCKPFEQGCLRSILSGSLRTRDRLHKANLAESPLCCFCGLASETLQHLWWHCPAWQCCRFKPDLPSEQERRQLPMCTQNLGIFMDDPDLTEFQQLVPQGGAISADECILPGDIDAELIADDRVVVWTDGACRHNQDSRLRRAGAGIFYAKGSSRNSAWALDGRDQTNQRGELLAVVQVLRADNRRLEVRTDSQYVYKGACSWSSWQMGGWQGDHVELWSELARLMSGRTVGDVIFTKVLGHAKAENVRRGIVKQEDKDGNDAADALATLAADAHAAPQLLVGLAAGRVAQAVATHRMMLDILSTRRAAEVQMGLTATTLVEAEDDDSGQATASAANAGATVVGGTIAGAGATNVGGAVNAGVSTAGATMAATSLLPTTCEWGTIAMVDATTAAAAAGNAAAAAAGAGNAAGNAAGEANAAMEEASGVWTHVCGAHSPPVGTEPG